MVLLPALGLLALVIWFFNKYLVQPYLLCCRLRRQGVRGAPYRPFIGQLPEMQAHIQRKKRDPDYAATMFRQSLSEIDKYGETHMSQLGPNIDLLLSTPEAIKEVLVTKAACFQKPGYIKKVLSVMGNGLVVSEGSLWERQRRMINPAFNHKEIKAMSGIMVRCANEAVSRWCQNVKAGTQELEMLLEFSRLTLDVIGRAAFGSDDAASTSAADEVYTGLGMLIEEKTNRMLNGIGLIPGYELLPTPANLRIRRQERELRKLGLRLIKRRRQERERGSERQDLLGLMLAAQDEQTRAGMTDQQLLDECMTFLLAGHETTAVLLTWTVYVLTKHPEYQERARQEVMEVLAGREEVPFDELHKLKLLRSILYETLRLYPPVAFMARTAIKDTQIAGLNIQKGTEISLVNYPMHVRESLWGKDAAEFRPERFLNGISSATSHPMAFLPFSAGPRICIGQNFALTEAKIVLIKLLRSFSFKLAPGYQHYPVMYITLKPGRGMPLLLTTLQ